MAKKNYYVDNAELVEALREYRRLLAEAEAQGKKKPKIPEYVGKCFILIAENYATKPGFAKYPCRDDMVLDAIENCVRAAGNFDPDLTPFAFSYFSKCVWWSFLRTIKSEKRELATKYKYAQHIGYTENSDGIDEDGNPVAQFELYENIVEFIEKFDKSEDVKKQKIIENKRQKDLKINKKNLENFVEE